MNGSLPLLVRWLIKVGLIPKEAVGQMGPHRAPKVEAVLDAGRLAERTYATLDALGRDVVVIARAGQNLKEYGLKYSHMGIAVRNLHGRDWGLVHLLTKADNGRSGIYCEGLVNFFSDNPYEMACIIHTLPEAVEAALMTTWGTLAKQLHCQDYSLSSHPWSLTTQNSNQWVLETLALATEQANGTRAAAQAWLKAQAYQPTCLKISLPVQWAGPLLRDSIRFDDQPIETRRQGQVYTVTVDSVLEFLKHAPAYEAQREKLVAVEISL